MRVHLDPHTGQTLHPEAVPAYLAHPANYGRLITLLPLDTFTAPARTEPSPGAGRAAIPAPTTPPPVAGAGPAGNRSVPGRSPLTNNN